MKSLTMLLLFLALVGCTEDRAYRIHPPTAYFDYSNPDDMKIRWLVDSMGVIVLRDKPFVQDGDGDEAWGYDPTKHTWTKVVFRRQK